MDFPYPITTITYPDGTKTEVILDDHLTEYTSPKDLESLNDFLRGQTRAIEGVYVGDVRRWFTITNRV